MLALSVKQPWAWLIVHGLKDIENRTWPPGFRGRIYVHASKRFDYEGWGSLCRNPRGRLDKVDPKDWAIIWAIITVNPTLGAIIGEVDIVDCVAESDSPWFTGPYGFVLRNPVAYECPIPWRGKQRFFEVDLGEVGHERP